MESTHSELHYFSGSAEAIRVNRHGIPTASRTKHRTSRCDYLTHILTSIIFRHHQERMICHYLRPIGLCFRQSFMITQSPRDPWDFFSFLTATRQTIRPETGSPRNQTTWASPSPPCADPHRHSLTIEAMVLRLHDYGAWIESEGRRLKEHAVEVFGNVISCYICSEDGMVSAKPSEFSVLSDPPERQKFTLHFDDDGNHPDDAAKPYGRTIDIWMDGELMLLMRVGKPLETIICEGVKNRYFSFASAATTGSSSVPST